MGKLDGKVAIVTGASRGIGREVAVLFAEEGAKVVVAARTLNEGDHRFLSGSILGTVETIRQAGGQAHAVACDVSNEAACEALIEETKAVFGPADVLVNNAALSYFIPVVDFPTNRWMRGFAVNVHGSFMLAKGVLPDMIARGSGAIVNLSSMGAVGPGRGPYPKTDGLLGGTMYGATKAALERFTQGLAQEVYEHGISVTCVSPSVGVPTEGTVYHGLSSSLDDPEGEPIRTMANSILLLATEPLDQITGRVCYSQQILKEFGWIEDAQGYGVTIRGSGFSEI
ncbi:MAG: SDR family NAD(P)-dependent oxidoreductase [Dehalococcoidia bacterium]